MADLNDFNDKDCGKPDLEMTGEFKCDQNIKMDSVDQNKTNDVRMCR